MLNIYDGTLGALVNTGKIIDAINHYVINSDGGLNYEVKTNDGVEVVCILGINDEENKIPSFMHPLVYTNHKGVKTVAMDFRLYVKQKIEDVINVSDVLRDKYNGEIALNRLIFTKLFVEENTNFLTQINSYVAESIGNLISTIITTIVYDREVVDPARIAALLQYYTTDIDNEIDVLTAVHKLPLVELKNTLKANSPILKNMYDNSEDLTLPSKTINDMVDNIYYISNSERLKSLTSDMLLSGISRSFFSSNNKEMGIAIVEHRPTLLAIILAVMTNNMNSKSALKKTIDSRKSITKPKDMVAVLLDVIKDNKETY